jgi:hypothetical protein
MTDDDRVRTRPAGETTAGNGLYLALGALLVAALVGAYALVGTPGLHTQVANVPAAGTDLTAPVQPDPSR